LAKLVFSAMIAGNTACFMTACIAGIFYDADDFAGNSR
jgi:nucleoside permease NupC